MLYVVVYVLPEHIWSKVKPSTLERSYAERDAHRRQRALPGDVLQARRLHQAGAQPGLLGQRRAGLGRAQGRRDHLRGVHQPRHDDAGPAQRAPSTRRRACRRRSSPACRATRAQGDRLQLHQLGLRRLQLLRRRRRPGATRCCATRRSAWRSTTRSTASKHRPARVQRPRQGRLHDDHLGHLARPGLPLGAAGGRQAAVRPREGRSSCWTPPATGTPTATASARTRRASPSRCACGRWPSRPRPRARASSSPAGSRSIGLKIRFEVVDNGVASDAMYAWKGDSPAPDYDMILWFWDGYYDPGSTLQCFTTSQIGWWNEVYWSNAEYDELCEQQGRELDPQKRAEQIWRMQEVMYAREPAERAHVLRLPAGREHGEVGRAGRRTTTRTAPCSTTA